MSDSPHITPPSVLGLRDERLAISSYREPALLRYLRLLWEYRLLILAGSLVPAAIVALSLALWPRKYTATFVYERALSEREYGVLTSRFYSRENLDKIIGRLREQGLTRYAAGLDEARTEQSFKKLVRFEVSPIYPKRLQTTDPATSERISAFQARLLFVNIGGNSEREVSGASAVVTGNLEDVLPLYDIRNGLKESMQQFKTRAAEIEDTRFTLQLDLQKEKAKLEKLKSVTVAPADTDNSDVVLQFTDVQNSREFLPLSYQVRAVQARIIDLEETLRSNMDRYRYYLQVLEMNDRLLSKVEGSLLTYYTVPEFLAFLGEQLLTCKDEAIGDYLKSYMRRTENLVLVNTRAGEQPVVYPVARYVAKGTALTFVVFVMVAALVAVLLEYRQERRRPSGPPEP